MSAPGRPKRESSLGEAVAQRQEGTAMIAAGARLVYLMGASGSGKDTLLRLARASLPDSDCIKVARRIITRPGSADEPNLDRERLELALQSARLGEYEWDMVRDVFKVSPRMAEITGLPVGEWPARGGDLLYRGVHPDDRDATRAAMEAAETRER